MRISSCTQLIYMFKVNNKKIRLICWMCLKLKTDKAWHSSAVFIVNFDYSQHINIVFLLLTLNEYLALGCERQVIMFWKHKKLYICPVIKSPISSSDLSLHRIEINCEHMTILWIIICFNSKFTPGISSVLTLFHPVISSTLSPLFPRDLSFFSVSNRKPI